MLSTSSPPRVTERPARSSASHLTFELRNGQTTLVSSLAALPLLFQRPLRDQDGGVVVAMLTPAGALFDGDACDLTVTVGPGCKVALVTTAATKLNRCDTGSIHFDLRATVGEGGSFSYLPHELIPFRGTDYQQSIQVDLAENASAALLEVISSGATDSPFTYQRLRLRTDVRLNGTPIVRERLLLDPCTASQQRGASHVGSLFQLGPEANAAALETLRGRATGSTIVGASFLSRYGVSARALGQSAGSVRQALMPESARGSIAARFL